MRDISEYGHVGIFCGGNSHERQISLQSGQAVYSALQIRGVCVSLIDTAKTDIDFSIYDRAFIVLHGRDGEDGKFQAILEFSGIPYTGSNVQSSSLSMNKWYTKSIWQSMGISTPSYFIIGVGIDPDLRDISFPVYVKPVNEGSSIGITRVDHFDLLQPAIDQARVYDKCVIVEQAIDGKEYTYSFISGQTEFPLICIEPKTEFYNYEAKYLRDDTGYIVDPKLAESHRRCYMKQARIACEILSLSGWGRIDFMVDKKGNAWFIEVNSVPGMTIHSLLPKAASAEGLDFSDACLAILESSYE